MACSTISARATPSVAASIRDLGRDTAIIAFGRDRAALALACDEVLTLADGIIVSMSRPPRPRSPSRVIDACVLGRRRAWPPAPAAAAIGCRTWTGTF